MQQCDIGSSARRLAELSNDEPLADSHNALLPPDAFHLPVGAR